MVVKLNKEDEKIRQRNKDSFHNSALYWNKLANERLFEIGKQLLGLALIILPLSGTIVVAHNDVDIFQKHNLLIGWFFILVSIASGFYNYWIEANFFKELSDDSSTREEIWSNRDKNLVELDRQTNNLGQVKANSSWKPLVIQSITLVIGVIFILIVINSMLVLAPHSNFRPCFKGF